MHGQIDEIQNQTFGSLAVFVAGTPSHVAAAVEHLRAQGVQVEEVAVTTPTQD